MTQEDKLLIDALCVAVTGTARRLEIPADWKAFIRIAKAQAVCPLVCDGLQKAGIWEQVPQDVQQVFTTEYMRAIYRDAQMDYTKGLLEEKLVEAKVPHIFLKGTVLKADYPVPALRTMSDMDVLIHESDYDKLDAVAKELEGVAEFGDGNHKNFTFPGGVLVEFHPNLLHHTAPVGAQINPGWQYAKDTPECYPQSLTEEGFYLFNICHLAYHFAKGGVGVRFVADIWVNRHLRAAQPDRTVVEAELERFGLLDFARNIEQLAEVWFGQAESTPLMEELGEYILRSGVFGSLNQSALNEVSLAGNRRRALLKRVFYPRAEMESRYPWCKGKPLLLPAAWCARVFTAVRLHAKHIRTWSKGAGQVTDAEVAAQKEKLARFGISRK